MIQGSGTRHVFGYELVLAYPLLVLYSTCTVYGRQVPVLRLTVIPFSICHLL